MKMVRRLATSQRMTEAEYRANLAGLNTFFGAVLGFVISGIENLDALRFGTILALLTGLVVSILYISASKHRVIYSLYTLAAVAALPFISDPMLPDGAQLPSKLQPTFAVWAIFSIIVEFVPREHSPDLPR